MTAGQPPKFFSLKHLSKLYSISQAEVRNALLAHGVMSSDGSPARSEFARLRYLDGGKPWITWEEGAAREAIKAAGAALEVPKRQAPTFTSVQQAEQRLCAAVARIGELAGFDAPCASWGDEMQEVLALYRRAQARKIRLLGGEMLSASVTSQAEARRLRCEFKATTKGYFSLALRLAKYRGYEPQYLAQMKLIEQVFDWLCHLRKGDRLPDPVPKHPIW